MTLEAEGFIRRFLLQLLPRTPNASASAGALKT
jgi:hypothetical protein